MRLPAGWKVPIETTALGTERIVWHNELTKGFFHKHVVDTQRITNYRVIHNNSEISLKDVDDIVVMNQHRVSQSSYMGTSTGRYARFGYGTSRSTGTSVGDVVFMYQGRPYIIFKQIFDPNGVARLAKSARKQLLTSIKAAEKLQSQAQKKVVNITTTTATTRTTRKRNVEQDVSPYDKSNILNCPRCSSSNPIGSRYCNRCGFRIDNKITDMGTGQYNSPSSAANALTSFNSDNNASMKQVNEAEFLTYESPFYKVKINYPANWIKVEKGLAAPAIVCFTSPKEDVYDSFLENVGIAASAPKEWTLDQYVQTNIDNLKINNPGLKILESIRTTLANTPAHRLLYDIGRSRYHILILKNPNERSNQGNNNIFFMILYLAEINKYSIYFPIAQRMINTFEFIG
jgi:hypothetical protein